MNEKNCHLFVEGSVRSTSCAFIAGVIVITTLILLVISTAVYVIYCRPRYSVSCERKY